MLLISLVLIINKNHANKFKLIKKDQLYNGMTVKQKKVQSVKYCQTTDMCFR